MTTIAELRRLYEAATPGPWDHFGHYVEGRLIADDHETARIMAEVRWQRKDGTYPDAALIAAAVNALPALLEVAEAAEDLEHDVTCAYRPHGHCNCDLEDMTAALSALEKVKP